MPIVDLVSPYRNFHGTAGLRTPGVGQTLYSRGESHVSRRYARPSRPNSPLQIFISSCQQAAVQAWKNEGQVNIARWNVAASAFPSTNLWGEKRPRSGYSLWMSVQTHREMAAVGMLGDVVDKRPVFPVYVTEIRDFGGGHAIFVLLEGDYALPQQRLVLRLSQPQDRPTPVPKRWQRNLFTSNPIHSSFPIATYPSYHSFSCSSSGWTAGRYTWSTLLIMPDNFTPGIIIKAGPHVIRAPF